jgi:protein SCO1/2
MKRYLLRHGLILLAAIVLALGFSLLLTRSPLTFFREPLPTYSRLPEFTLVESSGQPLHRDDLIGKIWVANFIYTTCPGPCLDLTRTVAELQKQIPPGVDCRFVSFTVDPAADTPDALRAYAGNHGADPKRWLFLTGEKAALYDLFENGFHITVADNDEDKKATEGKFIHTTKLVLIDRRGAIRGYYDGLNPESWSKLQADLSRLNRE